MPPAPVDEENGSQAGTIGSRLNHYLSEQHEVMRRSNLQLRLEAQVVHRTAKAVHRLDAELQTFAPIFDALRAAQLKKELAWFGSLLSEVSDREELAARIGGQLSALSEDQVVSGAVGADLQRFSEIEKAMPLAQLGEALHSERYRQLMVVLGEWRVAPPLTRKAGSPLGTVGKYLTRAAGEVDRRLTDAVRSFDSEDLQEARRAARHVRYAAEVGEGNLGRKATKSLTRIGRLEALLVQHAASVGTAEFLLRVGPVRGLDGEHNSFTFGRLYEQELRRGTVLGGRLEKERG